MESERYGVPRQRLIVGLVVLPLVMLVGTTAAAIGLSDRLPSPLATHWTIDGHANGTMTFGSFLTLAVVMSLGLWLFGLVAVLAGRSDRVRFRAERAAMAWCCGTTAFMAGVLGITVLLNLDTAQAGETHFAPALIVPVLAVGLLGALAGWMLAGPVPDLPGVPAHQVGSIAAVPLAPGANPVWQHHQRSLVLGGMSIGLGVAGLVLVVVNPVLGVVLVVCALVTAPLASINAVVDAGGLSVRFGPFGWPCKRVPLERIAAVEATEVEPLEWGGWGYRILPGSSAVVLRRGPAIVVALTDGRRFAVTVDDPERGAGLLEAYRQRAAGASPPAEGSG